MGMSWFWHGDDRIHFESGRGGMFRPAIQTTRKLTFVTIGLRHIVAARSLAIKACCSAADCGYCSDIVSRE